MGSTFLHKPRWLFHSSRRSLSSSSSGPVRIGREKKSSVVATPGCQREIVGKTTTLDERVVQSSFRFEIDRRFIFGA